MAKEPKLADAAIVETVVRSFQKRTKIPKEWKHMITEIVSPNINACATACGNLELIYRRTLAHAEELRDLDDEVLKGNDNKKSTQDAHGDADPCHREP